MGIGWTYTITLVWLITFICFRIPFHTFRPLLVYNECNYRTFNVELQNYVDVFENGWKKSPPTLQLLFIAGKGISEHDDFYYNYLK